MSTRYVWEKWNVDRQLVQWSTSTGTKYQSGQQRSIYYSSNITSNGSNIQLLNPTEKVIDEAGYSYNVPYGSYFIIDISRKSGSVTAPAAYYALYSLTVSSSFDISSKIVTLSFNYSIPVRQYSINKGSTSYGNVSSASSGAYPANSYSGNYWYVSKGNDTIDPASVTYPASPNGGELVDITIAPSTGIKFGGTIKYKVEYQLNGGSWQTAVESTTSTTVSVLIPKGTQTFAARATASDDTGFTSTTAVTGATVNVVNNAAPVISCGTSSLGEIAEPFSVSYSVSDEDGDTMTITEKIDGTVIRSYSASSGSSGDQTFSPDAMQWLTTLNGSHTATITADDGKGGVTTHSISFTRAVHTMTVTLEEPMETDAAITKCVVNIARNLPADAEWSLLVTNNAFDPEPVWEDITDYIKNSWNWVFENQTVTSGRYGFNFKLTCTRGASGQGGSVDTISGGFE